MRNLRLDKPTLNEGAREYAYRMLKANILNMILLPGDQISEAAAANLLSVSRTPVHDTFANLVQDELLCVLPQKGTVVSGLDAAKITQAVFMHTELGYAVASQLCSEQLSEEAWFHLESIQNKMYFVLGSGAYSQLLALDLQFHFELYRICRLEGVWKTLEKSSWDIVRLISMAGHPQAFWQGQVEGHSHMLHALRNRNFDQLCPLIYSHYQVVEEMLPRLKAQYPNYFDQTLPEFGVHNVLNKK